MCSSKVLICAVRIRMNDIFRVATSYFGVSTYLWEVYSTDYKFLPESFGTRLSILFVSGTLCLLQRRVFFDWAQKLNLTYF